MRRRLTINKLRALADALVKLDPKNRASKLPERHYREAEAWVVQKLQELNSRKKEPGMFD